MWLVTWHAMLGSELINRVLIFYISETGLLLLRSWRVGSILGDSQSLFLHLSNPCFIQPPSSSSLSSPSQPPLSLSPSLWCFAALSDLLNGSPAALFSFLWTMLTLSLRGGDRKQPVYHTLSSAEVINRHINCSSSVLISFLFLKRSLIFNTDLIIMLFTMACNRAYSNHIKSFCFKHTAVLLTLCCTCPVWFFSTTDVAKTDNQWILVC